MNVFRKRWNFRFQLFSFHHGEDMKKFLLGMLMIIPLIVILIVSLTASVIPGGYVSVEGVSIYRQNVDGTLLELSPQKTLIAYINEETMQLKATVYPSKANVKTVEWSPQDGVASVEDTKVLSVSDSGLVKFKSLGTAEITATAEGNVSTTIRVIVTSADVVSINIADNVPTSFSVGDRHQLEAVLNPQDAKMEQQYVDWKIVEGNEFVSIDKNGVVTALKSGNVTVRATLKNPPKEMSEDDRFAEYTFKVSNASNEKYFVTNEFDFVASSIENVGKFDISSIVNSNFDMTGKKVVYQSDVGSVVDKVLNVNFENSNNLVEANIEAKIYEGSVLKQTFATKVNFKKIAFYNVDMWAVVDGTQNPYLTLGSIGKYVEMKSVFQNVEIQSSNDSIVKIENGMIVPVGVGKVVISATSNGIEESFEIQVLPPVYSVELTLKSSDDKKAGIEMNRVFGKKTYDVSSNTLVDSFQFEINSIYTLVGKEAKNIDTLSEIENYKYLLEWSIDEDAKRNGSTLTQDGLLNVDATSQSVTVTIKSKYPLFKSVNVSISYTMKFVDNAVNVGFVSKESAETFANSGKTDKQVQSEINTLTIEGYDFVNNLAKQQMDNERKHDNFAIVLHNNMTLGQKNGQYFDKELFCNLFGNGNTIKMMTEDAEMPIVGDEETDFKDTKNVSALKVVVDDVSIKNVKVRVGNNIESSSNNSISLFNYVKVGSGIVVDGRNKYLANKDERLSNVSVEFCLIENAFNCVYVAASDVKIEGSVMRNSGGQTLYVNTSVQDIYEGKTLKNKMNSNVKLKNSIFTNSMNISIGLVTENLDSILDQSIEDPEKPGTYVPAYEIYFRQVSHSNLEFEGFCDIYNWKKSQQLDMTFVQEFGMNKSTANLITETMRTLTTTSWNTTKNLFTFNGTSNGDVLRCLSKDGTPYFQLGVANIGVHYPERGVISEDSRVLSGLTLTTQLDLSTFANLVPGKTFPVNYPMSFYCYDNKKPVITPDDDPEQLFTPINAVKTYQRLKNGNIA